MKRVFCCVLSGLLYFTLLSCEKEKFINEDLEETVLGKYELTVDEAKNILLSFMGDEIKTKSGSAVHIVDHKKHVYEVNSVYTRSGEYVDETIPIYEFIVKEDDQKGFALVVGDKRISSVLAYIPEGSFAHRGLDDYFEKFIADVPEFLKLNLMHQDLLSVNSNIEYFLSQNSQTETKGSTDSSLLDSDLIVNGFNELYPSYLYTKWGQYYPYNSQVPFACEEYSSGVYPENAPAGCVTVAIAQIMAHHRLGNYYWNALLEKPTVEPNDFGDRIYEVGYLMYYIGAKTGTKYNCNGSSASSHSYVNIMKEFGFNYYIYEISQNRICEYGDIQKFYTSTHTHTDYVRENLKENKPVFVSNSDHAYVVDGYASKNYPVNVTIDDVTIPLMMNSVYYHINAGWKGYRDGWYLNLNNYLYYNWSDDPVNFITVSNLETEEYLYLLINDESDLTYIGSYNPWGGLGCPTPEPCDNSGKIN